ncbi:MAG: serine/threonine-protein kinase [Planctomycetes bacterium]|nr:serine/threonine-protein kinase [Planctomycetota bacterium]
MRQRIEAMLAAVDDDQFLASPTAHGAMWHGADLSGSRIGPYSLLKQLGEGGFGSVYLAEQSEPIARKVALKVLKPGMDSREILARFDQERQALALMDHPNIARVLDAGTTDSGRPYVVMDLVEGEPIASFADAHALSVQGRLELFVQICSAVQHAHTKGIIHRDLKPSNVLVAMQEGKPIARIIDFGIAKAVAGSAGQADNLTMQQQFIGTPEYMSPEQAQGSLDLDTRTDVYSLGVLLYELLTGSTPFTAKELRNAGYQEMQRLIREVDPPNPSTRLASSIEQLTSVASQRRTLPQRLCATVRGELDWIVMKAIEKDRQRRYDSPSGLAADIARYLSGEPVIAAPPGAAYRVRKFVRRNQILVSAGVIAAGGLLLGAAGFAWQASVARDERDAAKLDRDRARRAEQESKKRADELEKVSAFQSQMIVQVDPSQAGVLLSEDVRARLGQALEKAGVPQQEREAQIQTFVKLWSNVNATDAARSLINSTILSPAIKAIDEQFKDQPAIDAALCHALADVYDTIGMRDAAMPLAIRALEIRRRVLGNDDPATLNSINNMGYLLQVQGRLKEADPLIREVLERKRRVLGEEHLETIVSINNMGTQMWYLGDLEQCERFYREGLDKARRTLGEGHSITLSSVQMVAMVLRERGQISKAEELLRDSMERSQKALVPDHRTTIKAMLHLSSTVRDAGRLADAEVLLRDASERALRTLGDSHPMTIEARGNLGANLSDQEKYAEAEPILREMYATSRRALGEDDLNTFLLGMDVAELLIAQNRFAEAEPIARDVLERRRRAIGPSHPVTLITATKLARILNGLGRFEDARLLLSTDEPVARTSLIDNNAIHLGFLLLELGRATVGLGDFSSAENNLLEAHAAIAAAKKPEHVETRRASRAIADLYAAWNVVAPGSGYDKKSADWAKQAGAVGSSVPVTPPGIRTSDK